MTSVGAAALALPDCRARPPENDLTPAQRMALLRAIAEGGPAAVEKWIAEEQKRDPRIRERVEAARAAAEREARARRRAANEEVERAREDSRSAWEQEAAESGRRERDLKDRLRGPVPKMDLTAALLAARPPTRPGLWARLMAWFASLWALVVRAWVRLVRQLRGVPAQKRVGRAASVDAARLLRERPDLRLALRLEGGAGFRARLRKAWQHLTGREDYDEALQRLAEREAESARAQMDLAVQADNAQVEAELEKLRREANDASMRRRREEADLEERQRRAAADEEEALRAGPLRHVATEMLADLRSVGLVDIKGAATALLLERFSAVLQQEAIANLPGGGQATPGHYAGGEGEYERGPMRSVHELGAIELEGSLVQARTRHPRVRHLMDDDVLVHRELRQSHAHVVIVLDTSGSMEEHGRLEAAKRVALVLTRMVRQLGAENRVDTLTMSTSVERVDLGELWNAKPGGFTNFGAALREARHLFDAHGADRRVLYLVTDGLPEAMTLPDGRDVADSPKKCLPDAIAQAKRLARMGGVRVVIYQLEGKDPMFAEAAGQVAKAAEGRVEVLDPKELMKHLMVELGDAVRESTAPAG